jgi:hypothetical protein
MKYMHLCCGLAVVLSSAALAQSAAKSDFIALRSDAKVLPVAIWWENGKQIKARGEDAKNAPVGASQVVARLYDFRRSDQHINLCAKRPRACQQRGH